MSFDLNVFCSSCWGYSLINTLKFKKNKSECKKSPRQQDREPCCPMWEPRGVPDHAGMPRLQASSSWKAWVPQPITFAVLAIHRFLGGAEAMQKRLHSFHWYESRRTGRPLHQIGSCTWCALHEFEVMMSVRTMRVVCLPLRICMNCYGTTLCISALCRHEKHACAPMDCRGMGCQRVLCNHCNTANAYFSCCLVPVAHSWRESEWWREMESRWARLTLSGRGR